MLPPWKGPRSERTSQERPANERKKPQGFDRSNLSMKRKSSSKRETEETAVSVFGVKNTFPGAGPTAATEEKAGT
jgi:hypothetical protein